MKKIIGLMTTLLCFQTIASAGNFKTVEQVDLEKYIGRWYEIASIPQSFQKQCVSDTTAEYQVNADGTIQVINSCATKSGERSIAKGRAKVVNTETNAELKVTFVHLFGHWIYTFGGGYYVVGLGQNYEYAIVGHPSFEYAWILSRTPQLDAVTLNDIDIQLKNLGYDSCALKITPQKGGFSEVKDFCKR